jgi:hypothetical protein
MRAFGASTVEQARKGGNMNSGSTSMPSENEVVEHDSARENTQEVKRE